MLYHILKLKTIPEPVFAHVYSCPDYEHNFGEMAPNLEIAYIKNGDLTIDILGETITAKEKSFVLLPHKHSFRAKAGKNEMHMHYTISAMIDKDAKVVNEPPETLAPDEICVPFYLVETEETDFLAGLLSKAISEYQKIDSISRYTCGALFTELLCGIAQCYKNGSEQAGTGKTQDIIDKRIKLYIHKNISRKITLTEIAEVLGKNPNYLNQVFKRKNNMSIISYVNLVKMKTVASAILTEKASLKDIGLRVGITDTGYLSRLFKDKMGMTISEFKSNSADFTFTLNDLSKII